MKWITEEFNDFIKLNRGFDLPNDKIKEGPYPVVASTDIKAHHYTFKVKAPGVVTGRSGSLGTVQYVKKDFWPLNTSLYVKDFKGNDSSFVYYYLKTMHLELYNSGVGVPTLNQNHLHRIKVVVPESTADQKRIATILSHYDDLIEINKRRIALLEESARELYKEWFVRMRFPGWRKEKTTAGIPSEWEIKNISQICDISAGKDRPEQVSPAKSKEFPYPIYSNGVDNNGLYGFASSPRVANNCITISARGTIGFVVLHLFPFVPIVRLLVLVPQKENLLYYLYLWAKCIPIEGNGTSQQQLTVPMIGKEKIIIPTEEILDQFNTYINELVGIKDNLIHANELLSLQRDRLLPRLMSGQLEV